MLNWMPWFSYKEGCLAPEAGKKIGKSESQFFHVSYSYTSPVENRTIELSSTPHPKCLTFERGSRQSPIPIVKNKCMYFT